MLACVMFQPGDAVHYGGSVCWPDGITEIRGDSACLVISANTRSNGSQTITFIHMKQIFCSVVTVEFKRFSPA